MQPTRPLIALVVVGTLFSIHDSYAAEETATTAPVDFARTILPLLSEKCFVCHGPDAKDEDALRLDAFATATSDRGGYRAINPDAPEESEILVRIQSTENPMPPQEAEKQLTAAERDLIKQWVLQGGTYSKHWAFVPPQRQAPEADKPADQSTTIDDYVKATLRKRNAKLAPVANPATLARRVSLVLTGLPPEPAQLAAFMTSKDPHAYEQLVDSLLDSPRYGEHQARYWLDAVRYGDTHGLHLDNRRGIYPYRDWVVTALNNNLPLDEFIVWQLAGDLLPSPTLEQRVATGFVRMNPSTAEGGAIPAEFQAKNNFDRTETLGTVFLGMSLTCARCHTHKYDPIPQNEYYRLLAFFNSTAEHSMDGNKYEYGPVVKAPANVAAWQAWNQLERDREHLVTQVGKKVKDLDGADDALLAQWKQTSPADRLAMVADPNGIFAQLDAHKRAVELGEKIATAEKSFTITLVAEDLPKPRTTQLLTRGEYNLPTGKPLDPGILTVMSAFPQNAPRNRLGLARWLTARNHPLVARVLINQIWQRTFGDGLVRTPEDFGLQGQQPTHPRLLDWLAVELHESGWNLKHILRLMVTSETFRQSSAWRKEIDDPENRLIARGPSYRLDAEVIRDIGLWASGLLAPEMGGEGVKPYQPKGLWSALMHPGSNTKLYVPDKDQKAFRRSLYIYWKRTSPHPMMTLFDAPSREASCVKRSRTNTSLQSLGLFNETQRVEMARALAARLLEQKTNDTERLDLLFTLLASRKPTKQERAACSDLLVALQTRYAANEQDARALLSIGNVTPDVKVKLADLAAWSQLTITVLASDVALLLY